VSEPKVYLVAGGSFGPFYIATAVVGGVEQYLARGHAPSAYTGADKAIVAPERADATAYRFYRLQGGRLGLIGESETPAFIDNVPAADTDTPPPLELLEAIDA